MDLLKGERAQELQLTLSSVLSYEPDNDSRRGVHANGPYHIGIIPSTKVYLIKSRRYLGRGT